MALFRAPIKYLPVKTSFQWMPRLSQHLGSVAKARSGKRVSSHRCSRRHRLQPRRNFRRTKIHFRESNRKWRHQVLGKPGPGWPGKRLASSSRYTAIICKTKILNNLVLLWSWLAAGDGFSTRWADSGPILAPGVCQRSFPRRYL